MKKIVINSLKTKTSDKKLELSEKIFSCEFNESLIHQIVIAYLAGGRAGTKAQKTRSEVSGGGKKPWKQKGTGRARAGTIRSPLWRGGGKTFAAEPRDYTKKVNKKMYRSALRSIFSELLRQDRLKVFEDFNVTTHKTSELAKILKTHGLNKVLMLVDELDENLYLASRNLPTVKIMDIQSIDPVSLVKAEQVVVTIGAIKELEGKLA